MTPVKNKSKKNEMIKWILTVVIPLAVGIMITIFSYGVQAGDFMEKIEGTELLTKEHQKKIEKVEIDFKILEKDVKDSKNTNEKLTEALSRLISTYSEIKTELSVLNVNTMTNTDFLDENLKYLQTRFDRLEERINKMRK